MMITTQTSMSGVAIYHNHDNGRAIWKEWLGDRWMGSEDLEPGFEFANARFYITKSQAWEFLILPKAE